MKKLQLLKAAVASMMVLGVAGLGNDATAQDNKGAEKCYGVAKAGKNDCQTASSACAGTSKVDSQPDAWIYLPKGSCEKVVGGSLTPKAAK
jgi:uncharacterized membrane protein